MLDLQLKMFTLKTPSLFVPAQRCWTLMTNFGKNACHALMHAGLLTTGIVIVRRNVGYKRRFIRPQQLTDTCEPPKM
jgi:hypothetical protein